MKKTNTATKKSTAEAAPRETQNGRSWLNLRMMEVFVAVVQQDGMTNAANHLGMTQSAVSQTITAIETGLGAQLIDRSTRPMQLTLFGSTFYERAQELLRRSRELEHLVDMQQNSRLPLLRIGMVDSFASTVGPHLLREIASLATRWAVVSGVKETSMRALEEKRVDLMITSEEMGRGPNMLSLPLLREPLIIVAPKKFKVPSHGIGARELKQLAAELPLVRYSPGAFIGRHVDTFLRHHELDLPREYEFDTSDAVLAMVRAGMGWTMTTPLCVAKTQAVPADYQFLPLQPAASARTLRVVAYQDEHSALWERVAATARTILKHQWIPVLRGIAPWAEFSEGSEH
ncbi:MAG TPA: LysR family transcriptional regulator [Ramlibacter sp.]|nr:LysR family transcriptional regulator [Ramlibacter sp.]